MARTPNNNSIVQQKGSGHTCHLCGTAISGAVFARKGAGYVCEGCFLGQEKFQFPRREEDKIYLPLVEALTAVLDAREHETGLHSRRVACHTQVLAKRFTADHEHLRQVYWGALLHDIGKIGVPDAILLKQGPLTSDEWEKMRTHPEIGQRILAAAPFMAEAAEVVLNHEERFDGTGYPSGLKGEAIPLWARVFAIVDTLDAITSDRPYRKGLPFDAAKTEILRMSGSQFDPVAVEAFVAEETALREMVKLKCGEAIIPAPVAEQIKQ